MSTNNSNKHERWYMDFEICDEEGPCEPWFTGHICDQDSGSEICYVVADSDINAHLIAAAPEMLEALVGLELLARDLLLRIDGGRSERNFRLPEEIMAAQAAIRKARGEE